MLPKQNEAPNLSPHQRFILLRHNRMSTRPLPTVPVASLLAPSAAANASAIILIASKAQLLSHHGLLTRPCIHLSVWWWAHSQNSGLDSQTHPLLLSTCRLPSWLAAICPERLAGSGKEAGPAASENGDGGGGSSGSGRDGRSIRERMKALERRDSWGDSREQEQEGLPQAWTRKTNGKMVHFFWGLTVICNYPQTSVFFYISTHKPIHVLFAYRGDCTAFCFLWSVSLCITCVLTDFTISACPFMQRRACQEREKHLWLYLRGWVSKWILATESSETYLRWNYVLKGCDQK